MPSITSILGKVVAASAVSILLSFGLCAFAAMVPRLDFIAYGGFVCLALGILGFISIPFLAIVKAIRERYAQNFRFIGKLGAASVGMILLWIAGPEVERHFMSPGQHNNSFLDSVFVICLGLGLVGVVVTVILAIDQGLRVGQKARPALTPPAPPLPPAPPPPAPPPPPTPGNQLLP